MHKAIAKLGIVLLASIGASAQVMAAEQVRGDITVRAARAAADRTGEVTTQRKVSYSDVSLTTDSGVKVLENRIREAARAACTELQQKYPEPSVSAEGDKCFSTAVNSAMADARKVIDSAKRERTASDN